MTVIYSGPANLLKEFPGAVESLSKRAVRSSVKGVQREAAQKIAERYYVPKETYFRCNARLISRQRRSILRTRACE